jgi:hypothetical protein
MALSDEARRRFSVYIDAADPSDTNPDDDETLMEFAAWALVNDREALVEQFAFQSMMAQRGITDEKSRYVQTILAAAPHVVDATDRERASRRTTISVGETSESGAARDAREADDAQSHREADRELGGEA